MTSQDSETSPSFETAIKWLITNYDVVNRSPVNFDTRGSSVIEPQQMPEEIANLSDEHILEFISSNPNIALQAMRLSFEEIALEEHRKCLHTSILQMQTDIFSNADSYVRQLRALQQISSSNEEGLLEDIDHKRRRIKGNK